MISLSQFLKCSPLSHWLFLFPFPSSWRASFFLLPKRGLTPFVADISPNLLVVLHCCCYWLYCHWFPPHKSVQSWSCCVLLSLCSHNIIHIVYTSFLFLARSSLFLSLCTSGLACLFPVFVAQEKERREKVKKRVTPPRDEYFSFSFSSSQSSSRPWRPCPCNLR